jgi:uncharacterized protein YrrD
MTGQPIAWMALDTGTPIVTSDGTELGRVHEVVADRQKDIFSGLTFRDGVLSGERFVPAATIDSITTEEVRLTVSSAEADKKIEPYEG